MSLETVTYDLRDGLDIHHHSIKDVADNNIVKVPGDELMLRLAGPDLLQSVHRSLNHKDQLSGSLDQRVHYALLNDETEDPHITLVSLQWGGNFQDQGTMEGLAELVAANPSRRFLVYDNLGYGQSDAMPKAAAKELEKTGRFDIYAEIVYGALSSIIKDHDKLDLVCRSQGALIGTELIILNKAARSLIVFDPPSTPLPLLSPFEKESSLFDRFSKLEKAHGRAYLEALAKSGQKLPEWNLSKGQLLVFIAKNIRRMGIQKREAQTMSAGEYGTILATALPFIDERYIFLSPEQSEMNQPAFIRSMISEAARSSNKLPDIIEQLAFNGTHAFAYGNPRPLTALETYSFNKAL